MVKIRACGLVSALVILFGFGLQAATPSISWPGSITVTSKQLVLQGQDTANLDDGTTVHFDFNNDGTPDMTVDTDEQGWFTAVIDTSHFGTLHVRATDGTNTTSWSSISMTVSTSAVPANAVPSVPGGRFNDNPQICTCTQNCGSSGVFSPNAFTRSFEATSHGVNLVDGTVITSIPVVGFGTRMLGFNMTVFHHSLMTYAGPYGNSVSNTWNFFVVQTSSTEATFVTPDLRMFPTTQDAGEDWNYVSGFLGTIKRDASLGRWIFTHHTGVVYEFMIAPQGNPGHLYRIYEPNLNQTTLTYEYDGRLASVTTDLGQVVSFSYSSGRCISMSDPLTRVFTFSYSSDRLIDIQLPCTTYVNVSAGTLNTTDSLTTTTGSRTITLAYADGYNANHITSITDARGAVLAAYEYDQYGRVDTKTITGNPVQFIYHDGLYTGSSGSSGAEYAGSPSSSPTGGGPEALALLDSNNRVTRVMDRMGYRVDYEMHTAGGGPLNSKGRWGLRRVISWTAGLRSGEPDYYEKRWLHDCNCLSGYIISDWFDSVQKSSISFDGTYSMPTNYARDEFTYNDDSIRRQVTQYRKLGVSGEEIKWTKTYQDFDHGGYEYCRVLTHTPPQAYDDHAVWDGLSFTHTYVYDNWGNMTEHQFPNVTRGVPSTQSGVKQVWTYNGFGQPETYTDENGNKTYYVYNATSSGTGTINYQGTIKGYLYSVTTAYTGSTDGALNLTSYFYTNQIGMRTKTTDQMGRDYTTDYFNSGDVSLTETPLVTHYDSGTATYQTKYFYDRAGHRIRTEQKNIDVDGSAYANEWIKTSTSFNAIGQPLKVSREVDETSGNDLVTEYHYNANDQRTITMSPLGTRSFTTYDERGQVLRSFSGVSAPTSDIDDDYPALTADSLTTATAVSRTFYTYDARGQTVSVKDGRDKIHTTFYDFAGRAYASRDPNGNGSVTTYDDAGNVLTSESGVVNSSGVITTLLSRSYRRYDERGRAYLSVQDANLGSSEANAVNPVASDANNPGYWTVFDQGGRVITSTDALGNTTAYTYDAANRRLTVTDAMAGVSAANITTYTYDANGNVLSVSEAEKLDSGSTDGTYVTTYEYDELNRQIRVRQRGKDLGSSVYSHDISSYTYYDSSSYVRLSQDAEDRWSQSFRDDLGRTLRVSRYAGDPLDTTPGVELMRNAFEYDVNSRKLKDIAYSDLGNLSTSKQETLYAYDNAGRLIRTVYPDSDDPIDGSDDGTDTIWDRVEIVYDATGNVTETIDQRGVQINNQYDNGGRLIVQDITLVTGVSGETRREFDYDALGRLERADNNYARVLREYDPLGRLKKETQSLKPDGSGFTNDWDWPVWIDYGYDKNGNPTSTSVNEMTVDQQSQVTTLSVTRTFDALNRLNVVDAAYFNVNEPHQIADYDYTGSWRLRKKTLGEPGTHAHKNASYLETGYDGLRRVTGYTWKDQHGQVLTGHEYAYDNVGNPLHERWLHDQGRYDNFNYDGLYQLTNVRFRDSGSEDYRTSSVTWTAGTYERFIYDDNYNRAGTDVNKSRTQDPMGNETPLDDYYAANKANEYTSINRGGSGTSVSHDRAGNMTQVPVIPGAGASAGSQVTATLTWDAFNRPKTAQSGSNATFAYCHDAFGRRIAQWDASTADNMLGRRYIWDGWSTIQERIFADYEVEVGEQEWEQFQPTEADAHSKAERVYVNGASIDEPLFVAIDGDLDGYLGEEQGEFLASINRPEYHVPSEDPEQVAERNDFAYYFLNNRMGSITALLARDLIEVAGGFAPVEKARILEYYRYSAYGSVTVLPVHDHGSDYSHVKDGEYSFEDDEASSGSTAAWDLVEDTALDLGDNNTLMLLRREADGAYYNDDPRADYGRVSQFGNSFTFTARRQDAHTGLMYYRYRLYEPVSGRFVGRDPAGYVDGHNLYSYTLSRPTVYRDPEGKWIWGAVWCAWEVASLLLDADFWGGDCCEKCGNAAKTIASCVIAFLGGKAMEKAAEGLAKGYGVAAQIGGAGVPALSIGQIAKILALEFLCPEICGVSSCRPKKK